MSRVPSSKQYIFSETPDAHIPRSQFDRSHGCKSTFDAGYLIPFYLDEALPGDTFNMHLTAFARLATPQYPIMDNVYLDTHFFSVPIRLIWEHWAEFNGASETAGIQTTDYTIPIMTSTASTGYSELSLHDYMGIPTKVPDMPHSSLWHRAYNLIYNEWFRDENLQDSVVVDVDDGPDDPADYVLLRRGKRHDYFTSCLPWPQKGTAVDLPLGTEAPVVTDNSPVYISAADLTTYLNRTIQVNASTNAMHASGAAVGGSQQDIYFGSTGTGLKADLTNATAATINELREAFQIQKLYERDARGGTRLIEIVKSHFGVSSLDLRATRPEYLGGGSKMININSVPQTSSTDATTPQGNLAAYGTFAVNPEDNMGFIKSFSEHCVVIGLVSVRADLNYQQGLNRMFSRSIRWDYYWPALAHIGEQAVLNKEIYAVGSGGSQTDDDVFGYQERFAEYRYKPNVITGQFRSNATTPLDAWHLAQDFSALPVLDDTFIQETPPFDRVLADGDDPDILFDSNMRLICARPMPMRSAPGFIDHF